MNENIEVVGAELPSLADASAKELADAIAEAKKVLEESQKCGFLESGAVWTKIYQVSGQDVVFEQGKNGLLYTGAPTKLYVNRVVYQKKPALITEEMLLKKAKRYSEIFELINGMEK